VDDEPEVAVDHLLLRRRIAALDPLRKRDLLRRGQQRVAADLVQEELQRIGRGGNRVGLENLLLVCLARLLKSLDRGRAGEAVLVRVREQRLEIRGFVNRADGDSFLRRERTERLCRQGEGLSSPLASYS
jgi:hypothetical protein